MQWFYEVRNAYHLMYFEGGFNSEPEAQTAGDSRAALIAKDKPGMILSVRTGQKARWASAAG